VTVVIPVRNGVRYLGETIDSVWAEDPPPADLIVVDDGSDDGSGAMAAAAGARVARVDRLGAGAARNRGVDLVETEFLAFLDADDLMVAGRLHSQLAELRASHELDGVLGMMRLFDSSSGLTGPEEPGMLPSTLTMRRQAFVDTGGFAVDLPTGEFIDWMARCRQAGRAFRVLDRVVVHRRVHDDNVTRDTDVLRRGYLEVARRAVARHQRLPDADGGTDRPGPFVA
jgi:glycosyltransferase involved in cell wall biosynthesis